jgi:SAM-dependent methyltransferase
MWGSGAAYEPYVGRWSRLVAERFVAWLAPAAGARWLDVGCGTGALTSAVLATGPAAVLGVDRSRGFLGYARQRAAAGFAVADGGRLPVRDAAVDHVVSGLVLNFLPDPAAAVAEMARACRPGGTVAVYVWDYAEGMRPIRLFWDAAVALDPAAAQQDEARRFPLCRPDRLAALFAGLSAVEVTGITVPAVFRDFDDYWTPFLGAQGPAPAYVAGLPDDAQARLRERLRATLPAGPIPLSARAYAIRGEAGRVSARRGRSRRGR